MSNCCPLPTALTVIPANTCPVDFGQIQRVLMSRRDQIKFDIVTPANNVPAAITGLAPTALAPWTILVAAVDSTKVIKPPMFGGATSIAPADPITFGGGNNDTRNGQTYVVGKSPANFEGRLDSLKADQTLALDKLTCERDLDIFFVLADGNILGRRVGAIFSGFPVSSAFFGGRQVSGFATFDSNKLTFQLVHEWANEFEVITPTNFNALTF